MSLFEDLTAIVVAPVKIAAAVVAVPVAVAAVPVRLVADAAEELAKDVQQAMK